MPLPLPLVLACAAVGGLVGLLADRLAARWPRRPDGAIRGTDWRTVALVVAGTFALGALALRWHEPRDLAVLAPYFVALLVLLATDLDQRLLPDLITLPMIPAALAVLLLGWSPLLDGKALGVASGVAAAVVAPVFLALTSRLFHGGLGIGDLKLVVSLGLMSGVTLLVGGFLVASALSSIVLVALLLARRLHPRSVIPFGPILIAAAFVAALAP